jgi:transposase
VHKKQVTVTARVPDPGRPGRPERPERPGRPGRPDTTRTFRAFYGDLLAMASWLVIERGVRHVAMESTGPYW